MRVVETNEGCCCVGSGVMENLPVVERCRDILAVVEINILIIVVHIRELEQTTGSSVHRNVISKTDKRVHQKRIQNHYYLAAKDLVLISKLFQFPLLNDWNCGATFMK